MKKTFYRGIILFVLHNFGRGRNEITCSADPLAMGFLLSQDGGRVRESAGSFYNGSQFRRFVDEIDIPPQVCVFKRSQNLWGKLVDTLKCSLPRTQLWTSVGITLANGREQRFNPKTLYTCIPGTSFWHQNKNNSNKMTKTKKKRNLSWLELDLGLYLTLDTTHSPKLYHSLRVYCRRNS